METRRLGRSSIAVSKICLGSMTWGSQNKLDEAHKQIDIALAHGVNFIDTAEMYPTTPRRNETTGLTEEIIGEWIAKNLSKRGDLVVATKITGEGSSLRSGERVNGRHIREALETSLVRLKSEYVDLYQLHWPNRGSYHFRKYWRFDPNSLNVGDMQGEVCDILETVGRLRDEGKLREFGLSNESAWGVGQYMLASNAHDLPRPVSVQNEYSLLCRIFDIDMAETAVIEDIGLLAFSPLAAGILSGKYLDGGLPQGSRRSMQPNLNGRFNEISSEATAAYAGVAENHGLPLNQMALAFCLNRPFMTSVIIGATSEAQLVSNLEAASLELSEEALADLAQIHRQYPMPM